MREPYKPEYLQAFGLLEVEWNRIETVLFLIFYTICGARIDKAHAIFFSLQNHRIRREMLEDVANEALVTQPRLFRRFVPLIRRLKNAARNRNEVIHCLWEWDNGEAWPMWLLHHDFHGKNILQEITSRTRTIEALRDDLNDFYRRLPARRSLRSTSRVPIGRRRGS